MISDPLSSESYWIGLAASIEAGPMPGGRADVAGRRYRNVAPDHHAAPFQRAANLTAIDLESHGHASPVRVPPSDLAALVARGRNE